MTTEQQTILWHRYNSFRKKKVALYVPAVYKALKAQIKFFADTHSIDNIPFAPFEPVIKDIYLDVGRLWAHQSYLSVMGNTGLRKSSFLNLQTKRMPIGFNEDFINAILQYFQLKLLNEAVIPITQTTRDWIRQVLNEGIEQGKGIDEIVQEIIKSDIPRIRANVIARTEIMKAANYGEQLGSDKTGLQTNKIWIAVRDKRTRHDHSNVDGQIVPDGKPFNVGGYEMQRPGVGVADNGIKIPAKEVVNCRCTVGRKVLRGANGLPLRA